ncbi:MAG: DNA repair protein RecN [Hyphomonadaceae bacterium]|nr:DNA repair protein RecN [Hyphomonadaceae bacterium]OUX93056.1 MAG: DNA repair protein RecN [Hyphomonas sp. TMED17]
MLQSVSIRSLVLIDQLDVEVESGFTALTGETGAGKSILLDALSLVTGASADRGLVRAGAKLASVTASFEPDQDHIVWRLLAEAGIDYEPDEVLLLKRVVPVEGASRAFVNDQPVNARVLRSIGESLLEIHSQNAASALMRVSEHRTLLDAYAGLGDLVKESQGAWHAYQAAETALHDLETQISEAADNQAWLTHVVGELELLAAEEGEASRLADKRAVLLQSEKLIDNLSEAKKALSGSEIEGALGHASRLIDRVSRMNGIEAISDGFADRVQLAAAAVERTLIELLEAGSVVSDVLQEIGHDSGSLESVESRLFSLRTAARKYRCEPDELDRFLDEQKRLLALSETQTESLAAAQNLAVKAKASWQAAADSLSKERQAAAIALSEAVARELAPLHLGRVRFKVSLMPISEGESGANGQERVEYLVETNPGQGFAPLKSIASGGELARFSLALKCALSETGGAGTLIFDEADQGVGGAVATAIGERLLRLSSDRQVLGVTHSPQVAASASRQWRVQKAEAEPGKILTHVLKLNESERLEEIARMLSGSSITDEARAAALKLLEAA